MLASSRSRSSLLGSLLLLACGDDGTGVPQPTTAATEDSTGPMLTTGVVDEGTDEGSSSTTAEPGSTGDTGFEPPVPECGNGYVELGEECDDGNRDDGDACSNACQVPCGLEWSTVTLGPTLDSEIEGLSVARSDSEQIVVSGRLREITVEMDGTVIEGDDTVLVQAYDAVGGFAWEQVLGTADGHARPAGVAVDAAGDVYVAATLDAADGGTAIRAYKLAAADGMQLWTHDFDGPLPGEDEEAFGIAVGPDGQPVISGQARVADGDDDVWLRKLDAADGTEVWTQTHSGVGSGGFSIDDGGPLAIAPDGAIFVLARIYEDFQTVRGTLLRFGADGGPPTWTFTPDVPGASQVFFLGAIAVDDAGAPAMVVTRPAVGINGWLFRLDAAGQEVWSRTHEQFIQPGIGDEWRFEGLAFDGDELVILGRVYDDQRIPGSEWWEPWVARVASADAAVRCQVTHTVDDGGLVPPSLSTYGVALTSESSALATGELV
ncbi:MAG: PQQ-binding-like beta-propeller repeat protein, partial [Myxococcales bacterium]|nr:PQQ-binding-like beta-propeller repeat protein [Myxococcales bacterium]